MKKSKWLTIFTVVLALFMCFILQPVWAEDKPPATPTLALDVNKLQADLDKQAIELARAQLANLELRMAFYVDKYKLEELNQQIMDARKKLADLLAKQKAKGEPSIVPPKGTTEPEKKK
jgi:hypothetical protein